MVDVTDARLRECKANIEAALERQCLPGNAPHPAPAFIEAMTDVEILEWDVEIYRLALLGLSAEAVIERAPVDIAALVAEVERLRIGAESLRAGTRTAIEQRDAAREEAATLRAALSATDRRSVLEWNALVERCARAEEKAAEAARLRSEMYATYRAREDAIERAQKARVAAEAERDEAIARAEKAEGENDAARDKERVHAKMGASLQRRIADVHTMICGEANLSPNEHHEAIRSAFTRIAAEVLEPITLSAGSPPLVDRIVAAIEQLVRERTDARAMALDVRELQYNAIPSNCTRCNGSGAEPPGCPEAGPCERCGGWTTHKRLIVDAEAGLKSALEHRGNAILALEAKVAEQDRSILTLVHERDEARAELHEQQQAHASERLCLASDLETATADRDRWKALAEGRPEITGEEAFTWIGCHGGPTEKKVHVELKRHGMTWAALDRAARAGKGGE